MSARETSDAHAVLFRRAKLYTLMIYHPEHTKAGSHREENVTEPTENLLLDGSGRHPTRGTAGIRFNALE